jgi:CRP-like cAMP-binding protein
MSSTMDLPVDVQRHSELAHSEANLFTRHELQRVPAGIILFEEDEPPAGVYILHSGEVALGCGLETPSPRLRVAGAGEILGLNAVISRGRHVSSAVAVTGCEVGFIAGDEFRRLVEESPAIWFSVLRQLSQDVHASYDIIRERSCRQRV